MSAGNKHKASGSAEERRQRAKLLDYGYRTTRLAEEGIYDRGDYVLHMPVEDFIGEAKNRANLNIHAAVTQASRKAGPDVISFVWWKRLERKGGNEKRTQVGKPIVSMTEDDFIRLLNYAELGMNR